MWRTSGLMLFVYPVKASAMKIEDRLRLVENELAYVRAEYQEYCSAISHDFSGPLRTMGGFSEIILGNNKGVFDEKTQYHFSIIMRGAKEGKVMLDAVREFSQLERNNSNYVEFDSGALVTSVLETLQELADISRAKIEVESLPVVKGDIDQIGLVFYQLIRNALMYRDPGVATKVSVVSRDWGEYQEFKVVDNGIGVPEKMDERIFQILKRAVSSNDYPGYGMGLAIAKKIVHRHGGKIQLLRDNPGQTVFSFTLPKDPVDI